MNINILGCFSCQRCIHFGHDGLQNKIKLVYQRLHFQVNADYRSSSFFRYEEYRFHLGVYVGTTLSMSCGSLIAAHWSWKWIFYLSGRKKNFRRLCHLFPMNIFKEFSRFFGLSYGFSFVSESPAKHPTITEEELKYIENNLDSTTSKV